MQNGTRAARNGTPATPGSGFVFTLWTDDPLLAGLADAAGIDRVGVDLESHGKRERQAGLGTWVSTHRIERLPAVRGALARACLFARVNPVSADTPEEVERLIGFGVKVLMLPMFRSAEEVAWFAEVVDGRAAVVPLLETQAAARDIASVASVEGVREIHVGVNDLALDLGMPNRFAVLDCELVERVSAHVRQAGLRFGVGGIGRVDDAGLPISSDLIYAQYPRLGATAALISRAFTGPGAGDLGAEVARSRARLARWYAASQIELREAHRAFRSALERCTSW